MDILIVSLQLCLKWVDTLQLCLQFLHFRISDSLDHYSQPPKVDSEKQALAQTCCITPLLSPDAENTNKKTVMFGHMPRTQDTMMQAYGTRRAHPTHSMRLGSAAAENNNWRKPRRVAEQVPVSVFTGNPANRPMLIPRQDIKPGVIIRAPMHQQDYGSRPNGSDTVAPDNNVTKSRFGDIFTKYRKMIVVGCFEDHFIAIPLYTHNGHGLKYKRNPGEYISIKDHRDPVKMRPLSKHGMLTTKELSSSVQLYDPTTTAHLTFPVSRPYNVTATPEGQLDIASTKQLMRLYEKLAPRLAA